ncbi:MAG TPA: flagellar hook capping FlgD N-terminal domain-containing protein [Pirellulaceae bacterium]|jgi:flagellar basal-body rod modification protein FlgD|nr:flagellar hook capping FlgD N-terminal domain-containing protein [Pirellulaceae bacterium]
MSTINGAGSTTGSQSTADKTANAFKNVDLDAFLQLMITELSNQDPLNPTDNAQFLQQITQMREISATDTLTGTLDMVLTGQNLATASSLIGKTVDALADDKSNVTGKVDKVAVETDEKSGDRTIRVYVGAKSTKLENVRQILPN